MGTRTLRAATRGSALARWQTDHVAALLTGAHPGVAVEPVIVHTEGDRTQDRPIWAIGGRGVFAAEVQQAVLDGRADVAVHSAKDLPSSPELQPPGLVIAAVPERGDPRDALVGGRLEDLPAGATVATGSVRRRAQLADLRPDLTFRGLRGNIETRLRRATEVHAAVVAAAALERLGLLDRAAELLDPRLVVPQVAQGALAVECRADDTATRDLLAAIDHGPSRRAVEAERAFLATLGGACDLPAGAHAVPGPAGLRLRAVLATLDGRVVLRHTADGSDPAALGQAAARHLLDRGGAHLLAEAAGRAEGA